MNTLGRTKLIGLAVSTALSLTLANQAQAAPYAYAVAQNQVQDFTVNVFGGSLSVPLFSTDTSATRFGGGSAFSNELDALQAFEGNPAVDPGQNSGPIGLAASTATGLEYTRGDAQITNTDVEAGIGSANNIAEAYTQFHSMSTGFGANTLTGEVNMATSGTIDFSFLATPFLEAEVGGDAVTPPSVASAELSFSITLTNQDTNQDVFSWVPTTDISGNAESSLNVGITAHANEHAHQNHGGLTFFYANGTFLDPGDYNLTIAMTERVNATAVAVPLPATLLLMGAGLLGLGATRRKHGTVLA